MKKTTLLIITLAIASSLPSTFAGPNHGHGNDHGHSHAATAEVEIPETREELWIAIQTAHTALLAAAESKADAAVHEAEGKLQAYLKALPEEIADLEESTRKRIEGQAHNLARAYAAVHHAADDKAWDKAVAEMKKADGGIKLLTAQMPK